MIARTVANGCEQLRNVGRTQPQPRDPQSETGTCYAFGKNVSDEVKPITMWGAYVQSPLAFSVFIHLFLIGDIVWEKFPYRRSPGVQPRNGRQMGNLLNV